MSPEVYMCYLISVRHGSFKNLTLRWKREFKTYEDAVAFQNVKRGMQEIRKTKGTNNWNNFNVEQLLNFITEYLYWENNE